MGNNPSSTLTRTPIAFCLGVLQEDGETYICTRIETHGGHCCDEVARKSWGTRTPNCTLGFDHGKEKGL